MASRVLALLFVTFAAAPSQESAPRRGQTETQAKKDKKATTDKTKQGPSAVAITQIPSVTITNWPKNELKEPPWWKPWGDAVIFNWPLILIGGGATVAALLTLRVIRSQTDALRNSERAWLTISTDGFALKRANRFDWSVRNEGRTTATVQEAHLKCRFLRGRERLLPPTPNYGEPIKLPGIPIPPNGTIDFWSYIDTPETEVPGMGDGLTQDHANEIREERADLVFFGYVKYVDAFGGSRETRVCEYFSSYFNEFRINLEAPAEYHLCS